MRRRCSPNADPLRSARAQAREERKRELARVGPRDLPRLQRTGTVAPALRSLIPLAQEEAADLYEALGGFDRASPQCRIVVEDVVAVGIALRGTLSAYMQRPDGETASRIATLAGARRQGLALLGLDRADREVQDLSAYLRERSGKGANGGADDVEPAPAPDRHAQGHTGAPHPTEAALGDPDAVDDGGTP